PVAHQQATARRVPLARLRRSPLARGVEPGAELGREAAVMAGVVLELGVPPHVRREPPHYRPVPAVRRCRMDRRSYAGGRRRLQPRAALPAAEPRAEHRLRARVAAHSRTTEPGADDGQPDRHHRIAVRTDLERRTSLDAAVVELQLDPIWP